MDVLKKLESMETEDLISYMEEQFSNDFAPGFIRQMLSSDDGVEEFKQLLFSSLGDLAQDDDSSSHHQSEKVEKDRDDDDDEIEIIPVKKKKITTIQLSSSSSDISIKPKAKSPPKSVEKIKKLKTEAIVKSEVKHNNHDEQSASTSKHNKVSNNNNNDHKKNHHSKEKKKKKTHHDDHHQSSSKKKSTKDCRDSYNSHSKKTLGGLTYDHYRKKYKLKKLKIILIDIKKQRDCHWKKGDKIYRSFLKKQQQEQQQQKKQKNSHYRDRDKDRHRHKDESSKKQREENNNPSKSNVYDIQNKSLEDYLQEKKMKKIREIMKKVEADRSRNTTEKVPRILSLIPLPFSAPKVNIKKKKEPPVVNISEPVKTDLPVTPEVKPPEKIIQPSRPQERPKDIIPMCFKVDDKDIEMLGEGGRDQRNYDFTDWNNAGHLNNDRKIDFNSNNEVNNYTNELDDDPMFCPSEEAQGDPKDDTRSSTYCRQQMENLRFTVCGPLNEDEEGSVEALDARIYEWFNANSKEPYIQTYAVIPENEEEDLYIASLDEMIEPITEFRDRSSSPVNEDELDSASTCSSDPPAIRFSGENDHFGAALLKAQIRIGGTGREEVTGRNKYDELLADVNCFKYVFNAVRGTLYDRSSFVVTCNICKETGDDAPDISLRGPEQLKEHITSYQHRARMLEASLKFVKPPKLPHPSKSKPTTIEAEKYKLETVGQWSFEMEARWKLKEDDRKRLKQAYALRRLRFMDQKPEDHSSYTDAWTTFWDRRHTEISEQHGVFVADRHDYNPEWMREWKKLIEPILLSEYSDRLHESTTKYAMDIDCLPLANKWISCNTEPQSPPFYIDPYILPPSPKEPTAYRSKIEPRGQTQNRPASPKRFQNNFRPRRGHGHDSSNQWSKRAPHRHSPPRNTNRGNFEPAWKRNRVEENQNVRQQEQMERNRREQVERERREQIEKERREKIERDRKEKQREQKRKKQQKQERQRQQQRNRQQNQERERMERERQFELDRQQQQMGRFQNQIPTPVREGGYDGFQIGYPQQNNVNPFVQQQQQHHYPQNNPFENPFGLSQPPMNEPPNQWNYY